MKEDLRQIRNSYIYEKGQLLKSLMKLRINLPSPMEAFHNFEEALTVFTEVFADYKPYLKQAETTNIEKADIRLMIELNELLISQSAEVNNLIHQFYITENEAKAIQAREGIDEIWAINERLSDLKVSAS